LLPRVRALAGLAAAASIVLGLSLTLRLALQNVPPRPDMVAPVANEGAIRVAAEGRQAAKPLVGRVVGWPRRHRARVTSVAAIRARATLASADEEGGHNGVEDQRRIRALLDSPRLRHVLLITDKLGGQAVDRVDNLVQSSPRLDSGYGRMTVAPEIIIDP